MNVIGRFPAGNSEMARAVAGFDWGRTPLGPIHEWPTALRIAVNMMINSRFPKCIVWGSDLVMIYNDAFRPILGEKPEPLGKSFAEVWAEAWTQIGPICERAFRGEATFIENFPLTIRRHGYDEAAYFTFCYSPIIDETGAVAGIIDTVIETTGMVESQKQLAVANAELGHRMKNMISVVTSIARSTLRSAENAHVATKSLEERLSALARSQDVLIRGPQGNASIPDIIEQATGHAGEAHRFDASGPAIHLGRKATVSFSLALHELMTNAGKYGALSGEGGSVELRWGVAGNEFTFRWKERGGPEVKAPAKRGFGSTLMERIVSDDFGGTAVLDFSPDGVEYNIVSPADRLLRDG